MANQNVVSMKALLEAGVHFGHQTRRWNPKMAPYIYTERNGIYIIDLQKTVKKLEEAYAFVRQLSENGQSLLFVGTKKQAQEAIKDEATRCGMYYVNARWLGGMMTNFKTMRTRIDRLNQLKTMQADGTFDMLPKKEVIKHLGEIEKLEEAYNFVRELGEKGETLLFVGTKKQAQEAIKEEASRVGMYYVNARWLGGMLTNFKTMRGRVDRLNQLKKMQEDGTFDMLPKKEVMKHLGEIAKLEKYLGGVTEMKKLPGALFVVDPRKERNAINEARKLNIPIVAIVDTNCDPDEIDYVIPGNDDAIRAIKLISSVMANAIQEGKQGQDEAPAAEEAAPAAAEQ